MEGKTLTQDFLTRDYSNRKKTLRQIIREKERALQRAPEGSLRVTMSHGAPRYYHIRKKGDHSGVYLSKDKLRLAKRLAQKAYDRKTLEVAEKELEALETLERKLPEHRAEDVYMMLTPERQALVTPIEPTDEEFLAAWNSAEWDKDWYPGEKPKYPTMRGEMVRSRIEGLIADMLFKNGWAYRYEYPVELTVRGYKRQYHPDFMILDLENRKEYLLEHFGMLHQPDYRKQMIEKMETYQDNGYMEGVNIIYTFESEDKPLDLVRLEKRLKHLLG